MVLVADLACNGSTAIFLGMLARCLGRLDAAERHLAVALDANRRLGSPPLIAQVEYERSRLLAARGHHREAAEIADRALAAAAELGMGRLALRARRDGLERAPG
jgi:ATP/maltotriose-dependent transcriptional regulator MalT